MAAEATDATDTGIDKEEVSVFHTKLQEFVDDLKGAVPEYTDALDQMMKLSNKEKIERFQKEVTATPLDSDQLHTNPGCVLPGIVIEDGIWNELSEHTRRAIWEHIRVLGMCCFLEAGFNESDRPEWMENAMDELKKKLESSDFKSILGKFMNLFHEKTNKEDASESTEDEKGPSLENLFEKGFPKIPEKFMKGHIARLAQEIVKEITPADLGISDEMIAECEKDTSRAFSILFNTFASNPSVIQKTITKIGNRLKQKVMSGSIRPQEIAKEAEELMKEFMDNKPFVEMMEGLKSAFGFEDMEMARKAGKEQSARMSIVRDRLRKKLEKKQADKKGSGKK
jgi:hypothetical protein